MSKGKLQNILNRLKRLAESEDCEQEPVRTKCRQLQDEYLKFDLEKELAKIPDLTAAINKVSLESSFLGQLSTINLCPSVSLSVSRLAKKLSYRADIVCAAF